MLGFVGSLIFFKDCLSLLGSLIGWSDQGMWTVSKEAGDADSRASTISQV